MAYKWQAIPEATWAAFSAASAGLAGASCVEFGASDTLTVAITAFIGAAFRLVIALIGAVVAPEGTVTT